jgi:uncharacterized membrane protein YdjX (TVP38/TMEM64 family)
MDAQSPKVPDSEPIEPAAGAPVVERRMSAAELVRKLGPTGLLGLAWTAMPAIMGFTLLYHIDTLSGWLREHRGLGFAGYVSVFIISAGLGLLPTYAQSILGGWVFGLAWGLPGALAGFTGGAMVGYFTARTVAQHRVEELIESKPRWRAVREALVGGGFWKTLGLVALVRVPPNSPFALTNLVLSTTGVPLAPYALGTAIGMLPRTAIAVGLAAAAAAAAGDEGIGSFVRESRKNKAILIGGLVTMFVVLGVIGHIANKALARATRVREDVVPAPAD